MPYDEKENVKRCSRCEQLLKISCFNKDKSRSDGLNLFCKECTRSYNGKWYLNNRDKVLMGLRRYRQKNLKKLLQNAREKRKLEIKNLSDNYIIRQINKQFMDNYEIKVTINKQMVERKRLSIMIERQRLGKLDEKLKPQLINLLQNQIGGHQNGKEY